MRQPSWHRSLLTRMLAALLLPSLALLAAFGLIFYRVAERSLDQATGRRLTSVAQACTSQVRPEVVRFLAPGDDESRSARRLRAKLDELRQRTRVRRLFILDRALRSRSDSDPRVRIGDRYYQAEAHRSELEAVFSGREASSLLFVGVDGRYYMTGYAPIKDGEAVIAALGVEGSAEYFVALTRLRNTLLIAGISVALVLVLVSVLSARRVTRPLRRLSREAERMGAGELEAPITIRGADEVGALAERMNQMRAELLERDRQAQMMLSGIAHEVRNPLGGIALFAGLLREELASDSAQSQMVARIERELEYLKRVVTEFLDYARRVPPQLVPLELDELLDEIMEVLASDGQKAGVTLRVEHQPVTVRGDAERLRRTLINVVANAIQACRAGGHVVVRCSAEGDEVVIEVVDDGCGIDEELRARVCEPFFTTRERGTGLGLALARKTVEEHQGRMVIDSAVGVGTTVRLILPREPSPASAAG